MLEKITTLDLIEILESGQLQVRLATRVFDDGVELGKTYTRYVLSPGDSLEGQPQRIIDITSVLWTDEVISAYQDKIQRVWEQL